jgi:hypothetical protein
MRWKGHVACKGEKTGAHRGLVGKTERKNHFEDLCIDGRVIFKWILKKQDGRAWPELIWLRRGKGGGLKRTR